MVTVWKCGLLRGMCAGLRAKFIHWVPCDVLGTSGVTKHIKVHTQLRATMLLIELIRNTSPDQLSLSGLAGLDKS